MMIVSGNTTNALSVDSSFLNTYTNCVTTAGTPFTGLLTVPQDSYNVYVRLEKSGQKATVQAYGQTNDTTSTCESIGQSVEANGDAWTYVGEWNQPQTSSQTILQIVSDGLGSTLDANRPSVMLVSKTQSACLPTVQCTVTVDGQSGYVSPPGTLPTQDSLHVVRVIDPSQDIVTKVTYFVNNQPVYSTPTLQSFDLRYVTLPTQTLSRVIQYGSGQQVVLTSTPPDGFHDTFSHFLFRVFLSNARTLPTILWILGIAAIGGVIFGVIHAFRKHRAWELAHGFIHERFALITYKQRRQDFMRDHITTIVRRILVSFGLIALAAVIIMTTNTYFFTFYRVDGHSMESSYINNDELFINKVPVTLASLSGLSYTPHRGDVVILHAVYGITDQVTADAQQSYIVKRVIGLPGERVVVKNSVITVYNSAHPAGIVPDHGSTWQKNLHANDPQEDIDVTLGNNELFVSGDNRPASIDSRFNGPIKTDEIIGVVAFKVWPL